MAEFSLFELATPPLPDAGADSPVTLGNIVLIQENCTLTALRFYKHASNTGTHIGGVWEYGESSPLDTVTFSGETASGWQEQAFSSPVALNAGTTYVIGILHSNGHWSYANVAGGPGPIEVPVPWADSPNSDDLALTLGCRLRLSEPRMIKGVAFALTNVGANPVDITVKLWTNGGVELASGSASLSNVEDYAYVLFDTPYEAEADTTYVVSYNHPNGSYFQRSSYTGTTNTRGVISILADDEDGPNGVFVYTSDTDTFPTNNVGNAYYAGLDIVVDEDPLVLGYNRCSSSVFTYDGSLTYPSTKASLRFAVDGVFEFGSSGQAITLSGISSGEAFGTTTLSNVAAASIITTGIPGQESFGTLVIADIELSIQASAISTAEAFGATSLGDLVQSIATTGVTSLEAFGAANIADVSLTISPISIESVEAFGNAVLTFNLQTIAPSGVPSAAVFGVAVLTGGVPPDPSSAFMFISVTQPLWVSVWKAPT